MKKTGFTLAEVLITLAIIGVVASLTIPTLMTNTTAAQFKTAYKKSISSLKQAIALNLAIDDFDFRTLHNSATEADQSNTRSFASILGKRMEGIKEISDVYFTSEANDGTGSMTVVGSHVCTAAESKPKANIKTYPLRDACIAAGGAGSTLSGVNVNYPINSDNYVVFQMADGIVVGYNKSAADCTSPEQTNCVGFVDVNGTAGPNRVTECTDTTGNWTESCDVDNDGVFDIFPIKFYNQTVEPGSVAATSIMYGYKENR